MAFGLSGPRAPIVVRTFQTPSQRAHQAGFTFRGAGRATQDLEFQKFKTQMEQEKSQRNLLKQREQLLASLLGGGGGQFGQPGFLEGGGGIGGGFSGLLESVIGDISQTGEAQRQRINQGFDASLQSQLSRLSDRGLGSSNLAANLATGVERERQTSLTELEDALLGRRASARQQIGLAGLNQQQNFMMQLLSQLFGG